MGKGNRGILALADYFKEALNPCMACNGSKIDSIDMGTCLACNGTGRQSSKQKRIYLGSKEVMGRI